MGMIEIFWCWTPSEASPRSASALYLLWTTARTAFPVFQIKTPSDLLGQFELEHCPS